MSWHELLEQFRTRTSGAGAFDRLAEFLRTADDREIERFALSALEVVPSGGAFLDSTLSHISSSGLARLTDKCVAILESQTSNDACESVLAYVSLQQPLDLQPHLRRIFALRPNAGTYYENWPWRGAAETDVSFLSSSLQSTQIATRTKAWECLLETRRPDAMSLALAATDKVQLDQPAEIYLRTVGFNAPHERLYKEACEHMTFPPGYFAVDGPSWNSRSLHPTWRLKSGSKEFRFGGPGSASCGLCTQNLHHLISLPTSRVFDDACDDSTIPLEVCLSCVGWVEGCLFYQYSASGSPRALDVGTAKPEFVAGPLRETRVYLAPTPDRWRWQDWALANARENLHRVGGHPCWIQSADFPECRSCGKTMHFLFQLDSGLPIADGGEWLWGSGGICYGFRCMGCRITAFRWQCT
jgi:hypothetical protein